MMYRDPAVKRSTPQIRHVVDSVLEAAGLIETAGRGAFSARFLPGHSNLVFDIRCAAGRFALRLARVAPDGDILPRADHNSDEALAAALAWKSGLGAEPVWRDSAAEAVLFRWVNNSSGLTGAKLRARPALAVAAVQSLRRFHDGGLVLSSRFDPAAQIAEYTAALAGAGHSLSEALPDHSELADALERLTEDGPEHVASHGDLTPGNILLAAKEIRIIDWEYAMMAPRCWDIGYLVAEAGLDPVMATETLAAAYAHHAVTPQRIRDAMLVAATMNALWRKITRSTAR